MSQLSRSSARSKGWSQVHFPSSSMMNMSSHSLRGNTGLPLIECPNCKKVALLELKCRKGPNAGKQFYKCPMNQQNVNLGFLSIWGFANRVWFGQFGSFVVLFAVGPNYLLVHVDQRVCGVPEDSSCPEDLIPDLVEATSTLKIEFESMKAELAELKACNGNSDATMCKVLKQMRVSITIGALNLLVVVLFVIAVIVVLGK